MDPQQFLAQVFSTIDLGRGLKGLLPPLAGGLAAWAISATFDAFQRGKRLGTIRLLEPFERKATKGKLLIVGGVSLAALAYLLVTGQELNVLHLPTTPVSAALAAAFALLGYGIASSDDLHSVRLHARALVVDGVTYELDSLDCQCFERRTLQISLGKRVLNLRWSDVEPLLPHLKSEVFRLKLLAQSESQSGPQEAQPSSGRARLTCEGWPSSTSSGERRGSR